MAKDHIMVKVDLPTIKKMLFQRLDGSIAQKNIIVDCVVDNLVETEVGLEQIYLAMQGIDVSIPYKVGDIILVPIDQFPTWRIDIDKSRAAGLLVKDYVKAEVTEVNPRKTNPLSITYIIIKKNGTEPEEDTWLLKSDTNNIIMANEILPDVDDEIPF